jgi:hypothetical protein
MRDGPRPVLTRHFFDAFFDFGFLTEEGRESFERVLLGGSAVAIGIGLLLVRVFAAKYAGLSGATAGEYLDVIAADHAFLIAIQMWVVACAVVLVGHAVFPDETDFRVLMAEPVPRATIFQAKLAALSGFAALFVAGIQVALAPLFLLTMIGPPGTGVLAGWFVAYVVSSVAASAFAVMAVVALHGVMLLFVPRARLVTMAAAARSGLVCLLVVALLFLVQLPAASSAFATGATWLQWAPPAWFVGLERWLLGQSGWAALAGEAIIALVLATAVSLAAYARLYRHFDRAMLGTSRSYHRDRDARGARPMHTPGSVRRAIVGFAMSTLRRSTLHQGIVVTLTAAAAGLVALPLLEAWPPRQTAELWALLWSPIALMFVAAPAVRLSLCVPIDVKANWIFRMTEAVETRRDVIAAGVQTVLTLGVVLPVAALLPLQWLAMGWRCLAVVSLELAIGWLFVEFLMRDWRAVPFTCSYVPGKGFVPHMFVKGVAAFLLFTNVAAALLQAVAADPARLPLAGLLVTAPALVLFIRRRRQARVRELRFEDEVPSEVTALRLNPD